MGFRAFVSGCAGLTLTPEECAFFTEARPWGLILFRRNIDTPAQVLALTEKFRELVGDQAVVLVDQEGGRVQRLSAPHWRRFPPAAAFERLGLEAENFAHLGARLIAEDLRAVGIDVDCLPVLDLPIDGAHQIIGDRAYGRDPATVARLGRAAAHGLMAGGVLPVMKHVPGHGRALADSHLELPRVTAGLDALQADFAPFAQNADLPAAMTAHVVYEAIDPKNPATQSREVVQRIIREKIGFDGLLISDDVSMKALAGDFSARAKKIFSAGVDVALHCNGDLTEARAVASAAPEILGATADRVFRARKKMVEARDPDFDAVDGARRFFSALAATA